MKGLPKRHSQKKTTKRSNVAHDTYAQAKTLKLFFVCKAIFFQQQNN